MTLTAGPDKADSPGRGGGAKMHRIYENENEGGKTTVTLELLPDGSLQLFYYDIGEDARRAFGDSDYESWITIPAAELPSLALALLAEKYQGRHDALSDFAAFCDKRGIEHEGGSWT